MIHSLWNKQKHSLNKNLLYYSTKKGGVGFHYLKTQILACKLIDLAKTAKSINNIATIVKSKLYKDFLKLAKARACQDVNYKALLKYRLFK